MASSSNEITKDSIIIGAHKKQRVSENSARQCDAGPFPDFYDASGASRQKQGREAKCLQLKYSDGNKFSIFVRWLRDGD